jgi:hypothetical protein
VAGTLAEDHGQSVVAVSGAVANAAAVGVALAAMLAWLVLYLRVAAPINRTLTAAAVAHVTPGNARSLQAPSWQ